MIASGTGITPMLQIIRAALKNPADNTRLSLIYANINVEDILLKKELDDLVAAHIPTASRYTMSSTTPHKAGQAVLALSPKNRLINPCLTLLTICLMVAAQDHITPLWVGFNNEECLLCFLLFIFFLAFCTNLGVDNRQRGCRDCEDFGFSICAVPL